MRQPYQKDALDVVNAFLQFWQIRSAVHDVLIRYMLTMGDIIGRKGTRDIISARREIFDIAHQAGATKASIGRTFRRSYDQIHYLIGGPGRLGARFREPIAGGK